MSFKDLDRDELYRSAIEDFAVEVGKEDTKKVILAALVEAGVEWADYVAQHPEVEPAPETPVEVVTSKAVTEPVESGLGNAQPYREEDDAPVVIDRKGVANMAQEGNKYLVKMNRENPLFEVRGYRFTKDHPYVLMPAEDAQWVIDNEDGFALAGPQELQEYYS